MSRAREELDLIVDKFAEQIVIASGEKLNATNLTIAVDYLRRTPQVIKVDEYLQALEIIVKKNVDIYDLKNCLEDTTHSLVNYNHLRFEQYKLNETEFDLISKVVKEIGKDDC